ncbi:MAG: hypothetical protein ACLP1Y_13355 [Candidatus Acidiferrales bacterium]
MDLLYRMRIRSANPELSSVQISERRAQFLNPGPTALMDAAPKARVSEIVAGVAPRAAEANFNAPQVERLRRNEMPLVALFTKVTNEGFLSRLIRLMGRRR